MQDANEVARLRRQLAEARERELAAEHRAERAEATARLSGAGGRTLERLAANPDLDAFLGDVTLVAMETFSAVTGGVWRADPDGRTRLALMFEGGVVRAPRGADPVMAFADQPTDTAFLPRRRGEIIVNDVAVGSGFDMVEPLREYLLARGLRTVVAVPMYHGDAFLGAMTLSFREPRRLALDEETLAQALANQGALAMVLARLSHTARAAAVSEERNRLARDIHDTLAQGLAAIVRQLESVGSAGSMEAARHVSVATEIARESLVEARRSIRALRPPSLEGRSLDGALSDLVQKATRISTAVIRLHTMGERSGLPSQVEDELLRIVNEALTNAMKHAAARAIDVELGFQGNGVRIIVRDDGVGFDTTRPGGGVGLSSMRERARRIGVAITVASEPASGTEVLVYWSGDSSKEGGG
jgi:signal transduction histidine kinase